MYFPITTNDRIQMLINGHKLFEFPITVMSNPEFLREGSAVYDIFQGK
jgi:UDPglucose 6-dehydrogenase